MYFFILYKGMITQRGIADGNNGLIKVELAKAAEYSEKMCLIQGNLKSTIIPMFRFFSHFTPFE